MFIARNRAAANGYGGAPSHLCRRVAALVAGGLLSRLYTQERGKTLGIVCVYLAEILLELTLGPISTLIATNELLRERSPFPRADHTHIYNHSIIIYIHNHICYYIYIYIYIYI